MSQVTQTEQLEKRLVVGTLEQFYGISFCKSSGVFNRRIKGSEASRMSDAVNAEDEAVAHIKKLFGKDVASLRRVQSILTATRNYWVSMTLPYPDRGVRLLRRELLDEFVAGMERYAADLEEAVEEFIAALPAAVEASRLRLGDLFNSEDYTYINADAFKFEWGFQDITVPAHLRQDNPSLYEQHAERARIKFCWSAVAMEKLLTKELGNLVSALVTTLEDNLEGTKKRFRVSSFERFVVFFDRFRKLNITDNVELDNLIRDIENLVGDNYAEVADAARNDDDFRKKLREDMQSMLDRVEELIEDAPATSEADAMVGLDAFESVGF